jgi:glucans biosynthesis protein
MRNDIGLLAIAPLTSMFFAGKASPPRDDYRPEIHDSDGLYVSTGAGERIWRPLQNPAALAISSFSDTNPKGFGLLQRERDFNQYQDSAAKLERRPGLWIEPKAAWGDGEVRLVEIPSPSETNDNIAAFWVSRWPAKKGERKEYDYRISALDDEAMLSPQARVVATRAGAVSNAEGQRRFVIEFQGGKLASLPADQKVEANVSLSAGKLKRSYVEALPTQKTWRLFLEVEPDQKKPVDMRAFLTLSQQPISETWSMVWRP